jgi:hypothetical protein
MLYHRLKKSYNKAKRNMKIYYRWPTFRDLEYFKEMYKITGRALYSKIELGYFRKRRPSGRCRCSRCRKDRKGKYYLFVESE